MVESPSLRVAYIISEYPVAWHTFIRREVEGLRNLDMQVKTFSIKESNADSAMSPKDRDEYKTTTVLSRAGLRTTVRAWRNAMGHPIQLLQLLAFGSRNAGATTAALNSRLGLINKALLLWDRTQQLGIRHLHAHFVNEANDIAGLAVRFGNSVESNSWIFTFTMHGPSAFFDVEKHRVANKVNFADAVACISTFTRSQLLATDGVLPSANIRTVRLGTQLAPIDTAVVNTSEHRTVLSVGRLVPKKGHEFLIRSIAALVEAGIDVQCTIIGDGPSRTSLEALSRTYGVGSRVIFAGMRDNDYVAEALQRCDVFCMPSLSEGLPVALMEAMSWQIPVVSTNIAGTPELIEHNKNGLLVTPSDVDELTAALKALLTNKEMRHAFALKGRKTIESEFNEKAAALRMHSFLSDAQRREDDQVASVRIP